MKNNAFTILVSGAIGMAVGAQFPDLTARAAEVISEPYHFSGNAAAGLQAKIEDANGVGGLALNHLNNKLGTSYDWADGGSWSECPIVSINLLCKARQGEHSWSWDYTTPNLTWTKSFGEPQ